MALLVCKLVFPSTVIDTLTLWAPKICRTTTMFACFIIAYFNLICFWIRVVAVAGFVFTSSARLVNVFLFSESVLCSTVGGGWVCFAVWCSSMPKILSSRFIQRLFTFVISAVRLFMMRFIFFWKSPPQKESSRSTRITKKRHFLP